MNNALALSQNADYYATLPAKVRHEVDIWMEVVTLVEQSKSLESGARAAAGKYGHLRGFSFDNIKRKVRAYRKHGWQTFIDKAKVGKGNAALSIGEHFKRYCQENQRSSKEAYRSMMRDFRIKGQYFEDVGTWRDIFADEYPDAPTPKECPHDWTPRGWTYRNLMRACGLSEYEITAARIGRAKARDLLPAVFATRANLLPGQIYQYDDMWHDARVNFIGVNTKARRPIELACVDVASACRFAYGIKPRREDIDTGKLKNLTESDMRMLLAHVLINKGYHPAGCINVVEHGTAAAGPELEKLLAQLSNGAIKFERSGIMSAPMHKGLFCGQAKGNPKRKSHLESQHSLAHTVAAALSGQMGKDRDHSPEQQYGLQQYNTQLVKCAAALPPERARLLMYPLLPFDQYVSVIGDLYREMNWRTWHDLEGWEEAGHVTSEFRLSSISNDWMPMAKLFELPQVEQDRLLPALHMDGLCRTRKLSPQEVWDQGQNELVQLPKYTMPLILGEKLAVIKSVDADGLISYSNREYGPSEFRYQARNVQTAEGFSSNLQPGRKYAIHINPFCIDECFVSDAESGSYIGLARRWETVCKTDTVALERQAGKQAAIESELRAPITRRGAKLIKEKIDMHRNNAAIFAGAPTVEGHGGTVKQSDMEAATDFSPTEAEPFSSAEIADLLKEDRNEETIDPSDLF